MLETVSVDAVDTTELNQLSELAEDFPANSALGSFLQHLVSAINNDMDVSLLQADGVLTPNQAAELLKVSRPHLLKLLDSGVLRFYRVGRDRRIKMDDIRDYIERRDTASAELAETLAHAEKNRRAHLANVIGSDLRLAHLGF